MTSSRSLSTARKSSWVTKSAPKAPPSLLPKPPRASSSTDTKTVKTPKSSKPLTTCSRTAGAPTVCTNCLTATSAWLPPCHSSTTNRPPTVVLVTTSMTQKASHGMICPKHVSNPTDAVGPPSPNGVTKAKSSSPTLLWVSTLEKWPVKANGSTEAPCRTAPKDLSTLMILLGRELPPLATTTTSST